MRRLTTPVMLATGGALLLALSGCHEPAQQHATQSDAALVKELDAADGPAPPPDEGRTQIEDEGITEGSGGNGSS